MQWVGSTYYGGIHDHCGHRMDDNQLICPTWEDRCRQLTDDSQALGCSWNVSDTETKYEQCMTWVGSAYYYGSYNADCVFRVD